MGLIRRAPVLMALYISSALATGVPPPQGSAREEHDFVQRAALAYPVCPFNGIPNGDGKVCCPASCGTCGGTGCTTRPGGSSACCGGNILSANKLCTVVGLAPCVNDDGSTSTAKLAKPGLVGTSELLDCGGGVTGPMNAAKTACCPPSCGTCGGANCATKPGGPDNCCDNKVVRALDTCETKKAAPCIPTAAPRCGTTGVYGYMNSKGDACCPLSCGSCEASTCANEIGGPASCCRGTSSGSLATVDFGTGAYNSPPCNTYFKAPCRITATKTVPPKPANWPNKLCTVDSDCKEYSRQPVKCSSVNGKKICTCVNTANQFVQVTVPGDFKSLTAGVGSDFNGRCIAKGTHCYNQGQGSCVNDGSSPAAQATCDSDKNTCVCPAGNYLIHVEHGNTYSLGSVYCFPWANVCDWKRPGMGHMKHTCLDHNHKGGTGLESVVCNVSATTGLPVCTCKDSSKKFSGPHNIDDDIYIYYFMGYCK